MKGKIYKIYNDINDKVYIGKTVGTLEERFNQHKKDSVRTHCEKRPLYNAINKYGIEHFFIELIEECELKDLSIREIYWIEQYQSYINGYNATRGGDGKVLYDYELIVELYEEGLTGKEISELLQCDTKVITNALRSANINSYNNMIKNFSKGVIAYDKDHNFIAQFDSESDAARWLIQEGIAKTDSIKNVGNALGRVARGQRQTAYKMYWEFVN